MSWSSELGTWSTVTPESASRGFGLTAEESSWRTRRIVGLAFPVATINDTLDMLTRNRVDDAVDYPPWTKTRFYDRVDMSESERERVIELRAARDRHYESIADMLLEDE